MIQSIGAGSHMGNSVANKETGEITYPGTFDWYVGYDSNNGVNVNIQSNGVPNRHNSTQIAKGYSRNVAATAKDISQGGMTKQEVQEFNMKHPNETAWRNE